MQDVGVKYVVFGFGYKRCRTRCFAICGLSVKRDTEWWDNRAGGMVVGENG